MLPDQEDPRRPTAEDLIAVIDTFHAMWNSHDLDGVLGFFTDDAVVTFVQSPDEDPTVYRGQAAIRTLVRTYLPAGHICTRSHYRADADRIVWMAKVSADCFQRLGVDWVEWKGEAILGGRRIAAYTMTLTPESLAKLETAKRGSEGET
jgi:SnoaL-like domain